ncbi:hypothetical protein EN883_34795 [Mesorhizobium sp. M7A.F.Ca.AU.002.06.1.1]|nr:hypothetical protein EOC83_29025 [Mesorhizobium sp. Primo-A]RVB95008.1 hypothetical protein EN881_10175 [Mesorhizobium sp. M7A.F.Ca.AU.002.04.1.1]RVB97284.1 hypothetical protein EN883_34795 [Mesorhizobium sp. M7A.F.Ca.AU.002.06.1.1]RVC26148.1 hypothetical protein EN879_03070 [Mesorhizobium sp. M7A.F.Ca.AU.002.02.1.1]TPI80385.1 hypothetical protein FJ438_29925 [Mesorhizobium sp. B2-8-7]TPJ17157.1 hypothetical protein FJ435_26950 [Mesorhizobium sp. B2-8-4]
MPHPDLEPHFADQRSTYSTQIADVIRDVDESILDEYTFGDDFYEEPRKLSELLEAEHLLFRQVWYNRHQNLRRRVSTGETKLVDAIDLTQRPVTSLMTRDTWAAALEAAKRTEDEVGSDNLGPWDDFEWGMLNGKLSALRWVLGNEWDMLDT